MNTVQQGQNLYGGNYGGIEHYISYIRTYFGQSIYDQVTAGFMKQSSVYTDSLRLEEWHMFGSSRIGIYQTNKAMAQRTVRIENGVTTQLSNTHIEQLSLSRFYTERGAKRYELTNHLGNVLTVVTDKKLPVCTGTSVSYFIADVVSATDYSPFGAPLAERTWQGSEYRYGFNTQERDDEIAGVGNIMTAEFWEYDTRLGRRWNLDPIVYGWQGGYVVFNNNPNYFNDPIGLEGENPQSKGTITSPDGKYEFTGNLEKISRNGDLLKNPTSGKYFKYDYKNEKYESCSKVRGKFNELIEKTTRFLASADDKLHDQNSGLSRFVQGFGRFITDNNELTNIASVFTYFNNGKDAYGDEASLGGVAAGVVFLGYADEVISFFKFNRNHIIPNKVYNELKKYFPDEYLQNSSENLKKLPFPWHANHPAYSDFVIYRLKDEIRINGSLSIEFLKETQKELRLLIGRAYNETKIVGEESRKWTMRMNDWFEKF